MLFIYNLMSSCVVDTPCAHAVTTSRRMCRLKNLQWLLKKWYKSNIKLTLKRREKYRQRQKIDWQK